MREYGGAVRGFLLGIVRRADVADDLTQEVFWRAWRARDQYREAGTPRAYLLKIADRLACDRARGNRREVHLDDDGWEVVAPECDEPAPHERLSQRESQSKMAAALDLLTPLQRRVLLLRYYGEMEFADIAKQCQSPLGTVLSHCHRGLKALKKILTDEDPA